MGLSKWWEDRKKWNEIRAAQRAKETCVCGHERWQHRAPSNVWGADCLAGCCCGDFVKDAKYP